MSNGKGLPPYARKAILAEEMGDGDGEVPIEATVVTPPKILEPAVVPPPPVAPDMAALIQALVTGITQANAGTADAIREALGTAAAMARDPIPENATTPGHSVYAHPLGEAHNTKLRCPMYLGIYDDEGQAKPAFEIYEDTCTEAERVELNKLVPGVYPGIERNDGVTALWRVVEKLDGNGLPTRLIIAVPQTWLSQAEFQQMPGQLKFLRQLNAKHDVAAVA